MSIQPSIQQLTHKAKKLVSRVQDKHIQLAVTGLSGSGKTAFITSLVNQLLTVESGEQLPLFNALAQGQFMGAKILPHKNLSVAAFPYHEAVADLADSPPRWPASTTGISQISIAVKFKNRNSILPFIKSNSVSTLTIDITDYPGEWLVDLPMLAMDYFEWSAFIMSTVSEQPRKALADNWLKLQSSYKASDQLSQLELKTLVKAYHQFLYDCRHCQHQLNFLQPGRAVLPGDLQGTPLLEFVPWHQVADDAESLSSDLKAALEQPESLLSQCKARYEAYKEQVVKAFYKNYFRHFDKQVVLVDCLSALNQGPACYQDMQLSLEQILRHFNYEQQSWLANIFTPSIKHLIIAASKADHLTPEQHPNLQLLLRNMLAKIRQSIRYEGAAIDILALASIKATKAVTKDHQGKSLTLLKGLAQQPDQEPKPVLLYPGDVPSNAPHEQDWPNERFNFLNFVPKDPIDVNQPIANIRMGRIIDLLLSEYL